MDIDEAAVKIHKTAREHGFWDKDRNFGEMLMLVTSELAEALEEDRAGKPSVYFCCTTCGYEELDRPTAYGHSRRDRIEYVLCPNSNLKPEGALVEIIDAIIRLLDTGQHEASKTRHTIASVMRFKMDYNDTREHMHGKAY
jgi:hypothetical protein